MLRKRLLHLLRADVRPVVHDDLLLAAEEPEVAVLVGPGEVASTSQPSRTIAAVAAGSSQYPIMRLRVRIHTRPTVPEASAPASSRTAMATPGTGHRSSRA